VTPQLLRRPLCVARILAVAVGLALTATTGNAEDSPVFAPARSEVDLSPGGLRAFQVALVINESDPLSVLAGEYYQEQRRLPAENVIRVRFDRPGATLTPEAFAVLQEQVQRLTPGHVQAYALAWTFPYRVGCMSITSAFAFGYNPDYCATGCRPTRISRYYDSDSTDPWLDYSIRPSMLLAGSSLREIRKLIDRGVAADGSYPIGTAYLVTSPDPARNVRSKTYDEVHQRLAARFIIRDLAAPLSGAEDVMFYFIGLQGVPRITRNRFLPGAVADHLTSFGGLLAGSSQMSVLRWLEAGATASFGTVVEPCNFIDKFPHPRVLMEHYLKGATVLEAYWKSVRTPGQGLFVGEPLASPFRL
jgi:uncharacterized protein (TIGR03790 family)